MNKTLERYQRCSYGSLETSQPSQETEGSYQEYLKLKARVDVLQRSHRNLHGEDLGDLTTKELEQLEHQLDKSLRQIRSIKTQNMLDQLSDLQRKEEMLLDSNRALKAKLEESCASFRPNWDGRPPGDGFFEPLPCNNNTLQIGYEPTQDHMNATTSTQNGHEFAQGWML
ncbi:hypothetical protein vseg_001741 [Gypsophila vaccaria]